MQQDLTSERAMALASQAFQARNLRAIEVLTEKYPRIIVQVLHSDLGSMELILESNSIIFQLIDFLSDEDKKLIMHKLIPKLFQHARRIHNSIYRSIYPEKVPYNPGKLWDLEKTINNFLLSGESTFTYKHVVCIQRKKSQERVILLIDKSHSVLKYLKLILLTSILFCLSLNIRDISLIGFDTKPIMIKGFDELKINDNILIKRLIDIKSGGKTNIYSALKLAEKEFSMQITQKKRLIMISDLLATSGNDFIPLFKKIDDVRILLTPRSQSIQLIRPVLGYLRKLPNVHLYSIPSNEREIPKLLEKVLYF